MYTWGNGKSGALGHGDWDQVDLPKKVDGLKDIVKIECGSDYTMALSKDGTIFAFGNNGYGQLGVSGNATKVMKPTKVPASKVIDISCGEEHSAYLDSDG